MPQVVVPSRAVSASLRQPIPWIRNARWASSFPKLKRTPLYDFHAAHGAKMVPFAGFWMPLQYSGTSVLESHHFTRSHASLFDVSHMVQHTFEGPHAASLLETITPCAVRQLEPFQSKLSALLWHSGGIVDDTIITRIGEQKFHVVTNAACRAKDMDFIARQLQTSGPGAAYWKVEDNSALVALQGPDSESILKQVLVEGPDLRRLHFGRATYGKVKLSDGHYATRVLISRGGYTGEDGFEVSIVLDHEGDATELVTSLAEMLLKVAGPGELKLAGLGARDSLRLEAGLCLYGHDLDDTTTPVEASLSWIIPSQRRSTGGFNGADIVLPQLTPKVKGGRGVDRRRVGFLVDGAPAREGAVVQSKDGEYLGYITSGAPSPTLGKNIAMGYIKDGFHKSGNLVDIVIRGKKRSAVVSKMPFVPVRYWKGGETRLG